MNVSLNFPDSLIFDQELLLLGSGQFFANMTTALICGLLIALFYRWTHRRSNYSAAFVNSLIALSMITTIVITVIGNNLARAFGLVGALSIVRFRMAIKDIRDIVFVFFALAVGMASGVDLLLTAVTGTIFIGVVMLVLSRISQTSQDLPKGPKFALQFFFTPSEGEQAPYRPILEEHCKRYKLVKAKPSQDAGAFALFFSITLKNDKGEDLIYALEQISGISQAILTLKSRKRGKSRKKKKAG